MFKFKILQKDKSARTGIISTSHGNIHTPAFVPVATQAAVKALTPRQLNEIGFDSVLCNTYHLYLRPGNQTVKKLGGLHKFMAWNKPIWTDSGGFQVFSLNNGLCKVSDYSVTFKSHIDKSEHIFTPEKSIQIQKDLGADIIFSFDECIPFEADYGTAKKSMERTHRWAERCLNEFNSKEQALYGIVQGGKFKNLRKQSAQFISLKNFSGIGIGSIFGNPKSKTKEIMEYTMKFLPENKPRHLLGIGSVDDIFNYVELGIDTFDCVLPTRLGRVGYVFILPESSGNKKNKFRYRITNAGFKEDKSPLDKNCSCYVCKSFSRAYNRHLFKANELLFYTLVSYHNLWFFNELMKEIRSAIKSKKFSQLKKKWLK